MALAAASLPGAGGFFCGGLLQHVLNGLAGEGGQVCAPRPGEWGAFSCAGGPRASPRSTDFLTEKVPCRMTSPKSFKRVHEPRAALRFCGAVSAAHIPRKISVGHDGGRLGALQRSGFLGEGDGWQNKQK